jgi:GNAT superfamily N-acetyltransferase
MTQTSSSPQVLCRPAIERDYPDIAEFCKGIWEGGDYVPEVWHHWFNDPNGLLATAEYDGRAIGCAKLTLLAEGQWWLEGFRVAPPYQGLKVGSSIHNYMSDWWQGHCDGTVRLMTSAKNIHVHHLCDKTGYTKAHEVCGCVANPIDEVTNNFSPAVETSEMASVATQTESIQLTDHFIDLGWRVCKLDEQVIAKYSGDKADFAHTFYWWKDKQGLFSAWEDEDDDKRRLGIGVLACALDDMSALLMDVRRFAAHKKFDEVFQIMFDFPQSASQLEAAGFTKHWEHNAFVFEKQHPNRV